MTPAFKELASLVKKQWKCSYLECSAKYNWRVIPIFKDILRTIELNQFKSESSHHRDRDHDSHRDSLKLSLGSGSGVGCLSSGAHSIRLSNPLRTSNNNSNNSNQSSCVIL
ncbi:Ras-like protein 9 [Dinothrombium tinctorium]|uniref:Ras-like protein 9 n=1 Tax=Dinothrombium tinctorium TaxID=1965070 RepID=A0A443RLU9_9ACAR|nr:Ras-like protein 9 [Dinothrombium tinctorium]